jgi:CIC family chloride channel protein
VIFGNFALDVFGPLVVASAVATLASHPVTMEQPLFPVEGAGLRSGWEVPAFLAVGAAGAAAAQALGRTLAAAESAFGKLRLPAWARVVMGGALVGAMGVAVPEVWGNGREVVDELLTGAYLPRLLVLIFAAKVLATSLSLGSGGAGGIFTPTMLCGATLGSACGAALALAAPGMIGGPAGYAVAGMAGALAALTHAPVTGLLMVFDMTRNYGLLLPIMLASVAGTVVARRLEDRSVYAERLRRRGVDIDMAFEDLALGTLRASDLMRGDPPVVKGSETLPELLRRFGEAHENQMLVVDGEGRPSGVIDLRDVVEYSGDPSTEQILVAFDLARFVQPLTVATPLSQAMEKVWRLDSAMLPVVDPARGGRLVGGLARKDLLNAFDREMLRKRLLLTRYLASRGGEGAAQEKREEDYVMAERSVPERFYGRSLADLELPSGRHLLVVALRRGEGRETAEMMPPPADLPLQRGDRLVLLGHRRDLDGMEL